ncbi:Aste57867_3557 [Aphanomyces stellatus]|uniref:Aste57867_3557 protein n=1 Tax=Aphanomyces stellatus TaxID=120398 RepID=A0A485KAT4_9STRA|nr:hypothetical protein As57867_003546 [Aphanomyces stellatus]VFT80720.1 Aste57867_3557 [Aphanomyces stellatus]
MRALTVVGFLFAVVALWAVTQSPSSSFDSQPHDASLGQGEKGGRSVDEKRALAIAFVQQQMNEFPIPGLTLSVVYKNETVIAQGFGTKQIGHTNTPVTASTLFQIGSYTKTFTALGIAKLVDDGRVQWNDPVKQHLPWFQLIDKYAEKYTTLADLLAMNSVLGAFEGDLALDFAQYETERKVVEHLAFLDTTRPLRAGYAYSNLNFVVLGQVIEHMTNQTWFNFIKTTYLDPLGMDETFGAPGDATDRDDLAYGHFSCNRHVIGPYSLLNSTQVAVLAGSPYDASGSIVSSANDLSKLARFLLARGHGILTSPHLIDDMTTGHTVLQDMVIMPMDDADLLGYSIAMDGNVVAAGYAIDTVGDVMFGFDFYTKNGDMFAFKQRNGFVPSQSLGVTMAINVQDQSAPSSTFLLDRMRSYVLGIFLDIPMVDLDNMWTHAVAHGNAIQPHDIECDAHVYANQPWAVPSLTIPPDAKATLVGTYTTVASPGYYGNMTVAMLGNGDVALQYGAFRAPLVATTNPTAFIWAIQVAGSTWTVTATDLTSKPTTLTVAGVDFVRYG